MFQAIWKIILYSILFCFEVRFSLENSSGKAYFTKVSFRVFKSKHYIQKTSVKKVLQCCWKCVGLPECLSLNIADQPNRDGLYECVLLKEETNESTTSLIPSQEYHHYIRFTDKCFPSLCMNGGTCETLVNDFHCRCPLGFKGKQCNTKDRWWLKISKSPVCFGAKNSSYGQFYVKENGTVERVKLVHLSGYLTCNKHAIATRSNWGCGAYVSKKNVHFPDKLLTIITDGQDKRILPQYKFITSLKNLNYVLPGGYSSQSPELVFQILSTPMNVTAGQKYRIWYGHDLADRTEYNNDGIVCVDVYMYGWFG